MKKVFFKPWIGENYKNNKYFKKTIMVLGESHYCDQKCDNCGDLLANPDCRNFITNIMNRFIDYKKGTQTHERWMNTYTRFSNIYFGDEVDNNTTIDFWNSLIFYNYIQKALEDSRISPTEEDFKNSEIAFFEVLRKYKPDLIIVWGERLWDKLPANGQWGDVLLDGKNGKFYNYEIDSKIIPAFSIYHPSSSAFTYEDTKYLQEAIRLA